VAVEVEVETPARRAERLPLVERPVLAGVFGALVIAFSGILVRLAGVEPATAAMFRCLYAVPVLGLLALRERRRSGPVPWRARRLSLLAGLCLAVDLVIWHYTIEAVGAGLATVLGNLQVLVVGLAAWWLLGERPARGVVIAVPVMLAGVVLLSGAVGAGAYGEDPALGVVLGLGTSIAYAAFLLVLRQGAGDGRGSAGPLLDVSLAAAAGAGVLGALLGEIDLTPDWPSHGWLLALALTSQVLGWMLISISLPRLPAVLTSLLLLIQPVGAVGLGVALLGERPSAVQLVGAAVVLAGVVVATAGRRGRADSPAPAEV